MDAAVGEARDMVGESAGESMVETTDVPGELVANDAMDALERTVDRLLLWPELALEGTGDIARSEPEPETEPEADPE